MGISCLATFGSVNIILIRRFKKKMLKLFSLLLPQTERVCQGRQCEEHLSLVTVENPNCPDGDVCTSFYLIIYITNTRHLIQVKERMAFYTKK